MKVIGKQNEYQPLIKHGDKLILNFGKIQIQESEFYIWFQETIGRTSLYNIKVFILDTIDNDIKETIINRFMYNNKLVKLSLENQMNFKAAYDLAIQTEGATLPYYIRCVSDDHYIKINTIEDFTQFYTKMIEHITNTLKIGRDIKDSIDWEQYNPEKYE